MMHLIPEHKPRIFEESVWRKRDPRYDTSRGVGIRNVSLKRFFKENRIIVFTKVNNCKIKLRGNKLVFIFAMIFQNLYLWFLFFAKLLNFEN